MRANVFWVAGPWQGRLGIVPRPRGGDWLSDEMSAWHEAGVDVAVSLLEPPEAVQLGLEGEATEAAAAGVELWAHPIQDRGVPPSREAVAALFDKIINALAGGRNVAVHCRQGIGRSGLVAAGVLVAGGTSLAEALRVIKESRGVEVPETPEQRRWLTELSEWLKSTQAAQLRLQPTAPSES